MKNIEKYDVIIIGGGASGLAAAVSYAQHSEKRSTCAVIEKESRAGRKLLATGGGRCNLTNLNMSADCYNRSARSFVGGVISRITPERLIKAFADLGLLCHADSEGRVYPCSNQASSMLDTLMMNIEAFGVDMLCGMRVKGIRCIKEGFLIDTGEKSFLARRLILAAGGKAQPSLGSDGSMFELVKMLGLDCTDLFPSLAPVFVSDKNLRIAKGVRTSARVSLIADGKPLHSESGELQINEASVSGICVFQLSRGVNEFLAKKTVDGRRYKSVSVSADLLPDHTKDEVMTLLKRRRDSFIDVSVSELFTGILNRKLGDYILRRVLESRDKKLSELNDERLREIALLVKNCTFIPTKPSDFSAAQVTAGGVSTSLVDRNMRCVSRKGLYVVGEALDVDGLCGGYNLHFAFASGIIAGTHAAKRSDNDNTKTTERARQ